MPFYEYECQACGRHHEAMQKMNDAPLKKCPHCGRGKLKRLMSAPVFRLKGGGWYETDFKSDQEQKRNLHGEDKAGKGDTDEKTAEQPKPADAAPPADAKSDAKSDGKTAAKAEPTATPKPAAAASPERAAKRSRITTAKPPRKAARKAARKPPRRR